MTASLKFSPLLKNFVTKYDSAKAALDAANARLDGARARAEAALNAASDAATARDKAQLEVAEHAAATRAARAAALASGEPDPKAKTCPITESTVQSLAEKAKTLAEDAAVAAEAVQLVEKNLGVAELEAAVTASRQTLLSSMATDLARRRERILDVIRAELIEPVEALMVAGADAKALAIGGSRMHGENLYNDEPRLWTVVLHKSLGRTPEKHVAAKAALRASLDEQLDLLRRAAPEK